MRIASGVIGREETHFEGPPPERVPSEMKAFIEWFNKTRPQRKTPGVRTPGGDASGPAPVRSAVAHLYFECIHPFVDGNGRIGRALSEVALSQELGFLVLLSLSTTIQARRADYYAQLKLASRGDLQITSWVEWFVARVLEAQLQAKQDFSFVLSKARLWETYGDHLNPRQKKVVQRMLREGPRGFRGGMSAKKYQGLTGCSKSTASRDLADLLEKGVLSRGNRGGRSTRYQVKLAADS